jgi:quinohemoprotein ethanol dehydrogenase
MTLAKLTIGGKERRVLMQAPKNGFFYVIDRDTGKLISAGEIAKQNWAERIDVESGRPVERTNIRHENGRTLIYPSGVGAHSWMRMAFSPKTGLVYVPTMQHGFTFYKGKAEGDDLHVGGLGIGDAPPQPGDGKGTLVAYDPVTQKIRWKAPNATMFNGGTAVTRGNLVFQGTADGWFRAYDAGTGKEFWKHYVGMGIIAAPSVWSAGGKQYVSVLAGYGGSVAAVGGPAIVGWKYAQPRRLVTYTLGGKAVIPNPAKRTMKVDVVEVPGEKLDAKSIAMGKNLWIACGACHGKGLRAAGGPAPDLRESAIPADAEAFKTLLKEGTLIERGMPRFTLFGDTVIEGLRQYIRFEAQAEAARQKKAKGKRS